MTLKEFIKRATLAGARKDWRYYGIHLHVPGTKYELDVSRVDLSNDRLAELKLEEIEMMARGRSVVDRLSDLISEDPDDPRTSIRCVS